MAKKKTDSKGRFIEVVGFMTCLLGVFVLISFLPPDIILDTGRAASPPNLTGPVGMAVTTFLGGLFGFAAPLVGLILVIVGWNRLRGNPVVRMMKTVLLVTSVGVIALTVSAIVGGEAESGMQSGALLGQLVGGFLVSWFSFIGAFLILSFATAAILVWTTGLSLSKIAGYVSALSRFISRLPVAVISGLVALSDRGLEWWGEQRKKRAMKRVAKRVGMTIDEKESRKKAVEARRGSPPKPEKPQPDEDEEPDRRRGGEPVTAASSREPEHTTRQRSEDDTYEVPGVDLLDEAEPVIDSRTKDELANLGGILLTKLEDFNIRGEILNVTVGPVVTTFEFRPASGIKVSQISGLADDLALAMQATRIRIVSPLPGRGAVGIEVPNREKEIVAFKEILTSEEYRKSSSAIPVALGKDSLGDPVVFDLVRMPHLLIAGSTGSGKSQCIHTIIMSMLLRFSPDEVRLLMIDPKVLELVSYNSLPHLLSPVVTEAKGAVRALKWLIMEMEERYKLLASIGVRNIGDYNLRVSRKDGNELDGLPLGETMREITQLPYIVMIIDELADLILTLGAEIEEPLARLAQMARGVGIHLVLATQRPSVDVLTGMIKANFPSRISFRVATRVDSRTILDGNGAEKLLGAGDMLFLPAGKSTPRRVHGSYITDPEIARVLDFIKQQKEDEEEEELEPLKDFTADNDFPEADDEQDELFMEAVKLVLRNGTGSTSLLQRKLKIGYSRAARIVDQLEEAGVLGPQAVGGKGRDVLVDESFLEDSLHGGG